MQIWYRSALGIVLLSAPLFWNACDPDGSDGTGLHPNVAFPTQIDVVAGDSQVKFSWKYPSDSTGVTFQVSYGEPLKIGAFCFEIAGNCMLGCQTQGSSCTVTGVTNGVTYTFTLNVIPPPGSDFSSALDAFDTTLATHKAN